MQLYTYFSIKKYAEFSKTKFYVGWGRELRPADVIAVCLH